MAAFDWDERSHAKCQKHGVSVGEIDNMLSGLPRAAPDLSHSAHEDRLIAVGRTAEGRAIFGAFTFREKGQQRLIGPVSARYMHSKESGAYDKGGS